MLRQFFLFSTVFGMSVILFGLSPNAEAQGVPSNPTPLPSGYAVLAWSQLQGGETVSGPKSPVIVIYDPYRYANASLTATQTLLQEADVSGLLSAAAKALGATARPQSVAGSSRGGCSIILLPKPPYAPDLIRSAIPPVGTTLRPIKPTSADKAAEVRQSSCRTQQFFEALHGVQREYGWLVTTTEQDIGALSSVNQEALQIIRHNDDTLGRIDTAPPNTTLQAALNPQILTMVAVSRCFARVAADRIDLSWSDSLNSFQPGANPLASRGCDNSQLPRGLFHSIDLTFADDLISVIRELQDRAIEDSLSGTIGSLSEKQYNYIKESLAAVTLTAYVTGGDKHTKYETALNQSADLLNALYHPQEPKDFALITHIGACGSTTATTIKFSANDRLNSNQSVTATILQVNCYPKTYLAAGVGVTGLKNNSFATTRTDYVTNTGAGPPPSPAPQIESLYTISNVPSRFRPLATSLVHVCFCDHPGNGWLPYWSAGIGVTGQSPSVMLGLTAGNERRSFFTLAGTFGFVDVLNGGNTLNSFVNSDYKPVIAKQAQLGITFTFSVPVSNTGPH